MNKLLHEFREFAFKGNVIDLAVGVLIGAAFQGLISSLTSNILSPIIGLFTRRNFDMLELNIFGVDVRYGAFVTSVVNFVIMAFVVFLIVKLMALAHLRNTATKQAQPSRKCPYCIGEIDEAATRCPHCTSLLTSDAQSEA